MNRIGDKILGHYSVVLRSFLGQGGDMSTDFHADLTRRRFLTVAGTVAAANSVALGNATEVASPVRVPRAWPVTMDAREKPISYTTPNPTGTGTINVSSLDVIPKDKVTWVAKTKGAHHNWAILFLKETPLVDANNNAMYAVFGSEADEGKGLGGTIGDKASGPYEYYVAVIDRDSLETYTADPKIIVGGGGGPMPAGAEKIHAALDEVRALRSSNSKEQKQIESVQKDLEQALKELDSK